MARTLKSTPEPQPEFTEEEKMPPDWREVDPNYGSTNAFMPIEEGRPNVTYYMLKANIGVPISPELISRKEQKTRNGGSIFIDYVNVTDLKDLLDERVGVWTATVRDYKEIGDELCVVVRISIHALDGVFDSDGTGVEKVNLKSFGDTFSNAYAQAFRRAAEGHGLGRQLWRKTEHIQNAHTNDPSDDTPTHTGQQEERPATLQSDPIARTIGEMITAKQLGLIRSMSREAHVDVEEECGRLLNCTITELSKRAASDFIAHLQSLQQNATRSAPTNRPTFGSTPSLRPAAPVQQEDNHVRLDNGPPATPKQFEYINNVCSDKGLNPELISLELFKINFDQITKAQASQMIEHLVGKR